MCSPSWGRRDQNCSCAFVLHSPNHWLAVKDTGEARGELPQVRGRKALGAMKFCFCKGSLGFSPELHSVAMTNSLSVGGQLDLHPSLFLP